MKNLFSSTILKIRKWRIRIIGKSYLSYPSCGNHIWIAHSCKIEKEEIIQSIKHRSAFITPLIIF